MSTAYMSRGGTERIVVFASNGASPVTGVTWNLKIIRTDNGQFWNGSAWQAGATTVSMAETDSVNSPGEYHYTFTPTLFSASSAGYICSLKAETSDASVVQKTWYGTLSVGYGFARDTETIRKFIANKANASGTYTIYEDDGTTVFATGTITSSSRTPT